MRNLFGITLCLLVAASGFSACKPPPKHRYSVPDGVGRIRYSPERGIFREGEPIDSEIESLYRTGMDQFDDRDYPAAAATFRRLRLAPQWVDGPRALDAGMMEALSLLEAGRTVQTPWLLGDLAGSWFEPQETYWRSRLPEELWEIQGPELITGYATQVTERAIKNSFEVTKDLFDFYSAGLGVSRARLLEVSRHARNLAWVSLTANRHKLAAEVASELVKRNPRGTIEAQALLMLALAETELGNHASAQVQFARIYQLSDDPALRERALMGEVEAIIRESKGEEYDVKFYELASEKINEYKTDFLVQHNNPQLVRDFSRLEQYVNNVQWEALMRAANDYRRLFEPESAVLADRRAEEFRTAADKREQMLKRLAGIQ